MVPEQIHAQAMLAYQQPWRKYHTLTHIAEMYTLATVSHIDLTLTQQYAILLHDVVYDIPAGDVSNEERSALTAGEWLKDGPLDPVGVFTVQQIIRDTERALPTTPWSEVVIDLDLAGLALNYWRNMDLIREESEHLSDDEFNTGRIKWLTAMLARDKIFVSGFFPHLEDQARANIAREIKLLNEEGYDA